MQSKSLIYIGYNLVNGKRYVGQTRNGAERWQEHLRGVGNAPFAKAIKKYGRESFTFAVLEYCEINDLTSRENFWIALIKPEYNQVLFLDECGRYYADETRAKISKAAKSRNVSSETRQLISEQSKARWSDPQFREKQKLLQVASWKDDSRRKAASDLRKGKARDPEMMEKVRLSHVGKKRSAETRAAISEAKRNPSPETRARYAAAARERWKRRKELANVKQFFDAGSG